MNPWCPILAVMVAGALATNCTILKSLKILRFLKILLTPRLHSLHKTYLIIVYTDISPLQFTNRRQNYIFWHQRLLTGFKTRLISFSALSWLRTEHKTKVQTTTSNVLSLKSGISSANPTTNFSSLILGALFLMFCSTYTRFSKLGSIHDKQLSGGKCATLMPDPMPTSSMFSLKPNWNKQVFRLLKKTIDYGIIIIIIIIRKCK